MRDFYISKRKLKKVLKRMGADSKNAEIFKEKYLSGKFTFITLSRAEGFPVAVDVATGEFCSSPICLHKYIGKRY